MDAGFATPQRWELYRLLSEPSRLKLLALAGSEELSIGELAELMREAQPNISKHAAPLRRLGLLSLRKQGTRVFLRLGADVSADPVLQDAIATGRALCERDGSLARIPEIVRAREDDSRAFFASAPGSELAASSLPTEMPAYLSALSPLIASRSLAVDAGTGDGSLLDVLAPLYERVIAIDRSPLQLGRAKARLLARGYENVELLRAEIDDLDVKQRVEDAGLADVVMASRVLHHSRRPQETVAILAGLAKPGGTVLIIDYLAHHDESLREQQADLWLGFEPDELRGWMRAAGLEGVRHQPIPVTRCGSGPDGQIPWQMVLGRRPKVNEKIRARG